MNTKQVHVVIVLLQKHRCLMIQGSHTFWQINFHGNVLVSQKFLDEEILKSLKEEKLRY